MELLSLDALYGARGTIAYALVFVFAATPWIELLLVIPAGIGIGLNPFVVAVTAFLGNLSTVYLILLGHQALQSVWDKFKIQDGISASSKKRTKTLQIWDKYGLPGLALTSPVAVGTHFATVIAISLGSKKQEVGFWMSLSILIWTLLVTAASYYGIESIKWFLE